MNYIIFKGIDSTDINGLLICELPPISKPPMRVEETFVSGRDGSTFREQGYSSYEKNVHIGLRGDFDIDEVIKYFSGDGDIVFSNEPDKVYHAKITDQIDYERLLRYRQATIPFIVQPFKYKNNEVVSETETATATGASLHISDIYKFTSLLVEGGAGTIKAVGKNLFDYKTRLSANSNGITNVMNADGSITSHGILNANHAYITGCDLDKMLVNGHSYTMSQRFLSEKVYMQLNITNKTTGKTSYIHLANSTRRTFVADTESNTYTLLVQTTSVSYYGSEYAETTNYYQLEEGTVSTDFEPYVSNGYDYEEGEEISDKITVYPAKTTLFNTNSAIMAVIYTKPFEVVNVGLEESKPIMTIKGSGTIELSINGVGVFSYTFPDGEDKVVIDSEKEDAYLGTVLKNRNMLGEFPTLARGINRITWSGNVTSISVEPRSRWL